MLISTVQTEQAMDLFKVRGAGSVRAAGLINYTCGTVVRSAGIFISLGKRILTDFECHRAILRR